MTPRARHELHELFKSDALIEAVEELRAELKTQATSRDPGRRDEALHTYWGLEALIVRVQATLTQEGDQADG